MPLASRARATIAATAIINLSLPRGVRFMKVSVVSQRVSARPHFRHPKRPGSEFAIEILKHADQGHLQIVRRSCREPYDDQSAHRRHRAVALLRLCDLAK